MSTTVIDFLAAQRSTAKVKTGVQLLQSPTPVMFVILRFVKGSPKKFRNPRRDRLVLIHRATMGPIN
jgi:hypothetical protein